MSQRIFLSDFQSFDSDGAGIEYLSRINILVGPNNAGKSKILRAVDRTIRGHEESLIAESGLPYTIEVSKELS